MFTFSLSATLHPAPTVRPYTSTHNHTWLSNVHFSDPACNRVNWNSGVNCSNPAVFNPVQLNISNWIESYKAVGAKHAVMTAKQSVMAGFEVPVTMTALVTPHSPRSLIDFFPTTVPVAAVFCCGTPTLRCLTAPSTALQSSGRHTLALDVTLSPNLAS